MILGLLPAHFCLDPEDITDLPISKFLNTHFSPPESLLGFCFLILCVLLVTLIVYTIFIIIPQCILNACLNCCFPRFKSREFGLIGDALMCIGTFGMALGFLMDLYNIESWIFYTSPAVIFLAFDLNERSRLLRIVHPGFTFLLFLLSVPLTLFFFNTYPQTRIFACESSYKLLMGSHVFIISLFLSLSISSFFNFREIVRSEQLNLVKDGQVIGYLVKKGTEWVEFKYSDEEEEKDSDMEKLMFDV